jgi:hypothetical protein
MTKLWECSSGETPCPRGASVYGEGMGLLQGKEDLSLWLARSLGSDMLLKKHFHG